MTREISISSAKNIDQLTASNTVDFDPRPRGIIVGAGTLVIVNDDDTTQSLASGVLASGVVHPISPKRINATGTTATIYGVY